MAEDLTEYLKDIGIKVQYLHSDVSTFDRTDILRDLRLGVYDVVIGINLLREGLDLPEVSLVAIIDADKEGFLRSESSLIQTIGRAARHQEGTVIMYADNVTKSIVSSVAETRRRRKLQEDFNKEHGITPISIKKDIRVSLERSEEAKVDIDEIDLEKKAESFKLMDKSQRKKFLQELKFQIELHADMMEFEKAADLRDEIELLRREIA
jgi:excinuclease ABC subunit B